MDAKGQSTPEAGTYRIVQEVAMDLEGAAHALTIVEEAAPDTERRHHLEAIRAAIATLRTIVALPSRDGHAPQDPAITVRDLQRQGEIPAP